MYSFPEEWQLLNKQTKLLLIKWGYMQLSNRYLVTVAITMKLFSTRMINQQQHTHTQSTGAAVVHHWTLPYKVTLQSHYIIYFKNNNWWTHTHTHMYTYSTGIQFLETIIIIYYNNYSVIINNLSSRHYYSSKIHMFQWLMDTELHYYSIITTTHTHTTNYYYHITTTTTTSSSVYTHTHTYSYSLRTSR